LVEVRIAPVPLPTNSLLLVIIGEAQFLIDAASNVPVDMIRVSAVNALPPLNGLLRCSHWP
jgi:hypothetical protein